MKKIQGWYYQKLTQMSVFKNLSFDFWPIHSLFTSVFLSVQANIIKFLFLLLFDSPMSLVFELNQKNRNVYGIKFHFINTFYSMLNKYRYYLFYIQIPYCHWFYNLLNHIKILR
jgi:hypothetical protein